MAERVRHIIRCTIWLDLASCAPRKNIECPGRVLPVLPVFSTLFTVPKNLGKTPFQNLGTILSPLVATSNFEVSEVLQMVRLFRGRHWGLFFDGILFPTIDDNCPRFTHVKKWKKPLHHFVFSKIELCSEDPCLAYISFGEKCLNIFSL